ncbi:MAG: GntR family transcriptional regulator [Parvibaculales bacterium]
MSAASERAYSLIREAIVDGRLDTGRKLNEEELVKICSVSRTPVRDALKKLAYEGYIIIRKNQGAWVKTWSELEVREVFNARVVMEGYIIGLAAEKATPTAVKSLGALVDDFEAVMARKPGLNKLVPLFLDNNQQFHELIYDIADNPRLSDIMRTVSPLPVVYQTANSYDVARITQSNLDHRRMVASIAAKDKKWAQVIMEGHIHAAAAVYNKNYKK